MTTFEMHERNIMQQEEIRALRRKIDELCKEIDRLRSRPPVMYDDKTMILPSSPEIGDSNPEYTRQGILGAYDPLFGRKPPESIW